MQIFVVLFFVLFFVAMARVIAQWFKNEKSPRLTVPAVIVDKQRKTHHRHSSGHRHHTHSYHVTFQVESGDRMELQVGAQATVIPTIGLLPAPISPIISTWAGTELLPAN